MPSPRKPCPRCGEPMHSASTICMACTRKTQHGGASRTITTRDIFRAVDLAEAQNPATRPEHYPPPCPACNGYAYTRHPRYWKKCNQCRAHPGHQCSHEDWTALRA